MIVETMSDKELLAEIDNDFLEIAKFIVDIKYNTAYKKRLQWGRPKNGDFIIRINDWKSSNGNAYTYYIRTKDWNDFKKGLFMVCTVTFFRRNNAMNAIRILLDGDGDPSIEIFTSHFIDRYNQRFLKQPYLSRKEVVMKFIDRNDHLVIQKLESSKYDHNMMTGTNDGYIFGKFEDEQIKVYKTFVTREMLFGNQYDTADHLDELVIGAQNGVESNMFDIDKKMWELIQSEKVIPTLDDLQIALDMIEEGKEKKAKLERVGKEFDKEFLEKQNKYFLFVNGFDWSSGKIRDEDGTIINYPPLIELSRTIIPA